MQHSHLESEMNPEEQASLVRDLLSSGGVISIKLAQMLAEEAKVPLYYRRLLGGLRESNDPMHVSLFWHSIPKSVRRHIKEMGNCIGTGSVKQVHICKFDDGKEYAVAVLRRNVEEEALSSLDALTNAEDVAIVAKRLGRLVFGEFNLFSEGEALEEFAATPIGLHHRFSVVRVHHHSPKCLVEEVARGETISKALKGCGKDWREKHPNVQNIMLLLTEYHRAVFDAFIKDGLIHSDIHLGNAIVQLDGEDVRFALFDVGQFETIGPADTRAILWSLSWLSTPARHTELRNVALDHLCRTSSLRDVDESMDSKEKLRLLETKILEAFRGAVSPFEDGTLPDKKQAFFRFLRNSEHLGVCLPKGAFAVAKMLDGILSQEISFALPSVVDDSIENFLRAGMTWGETLSIVGVKLFGGGKDGIVVDPIVVPVPSSSSNNDDDDVSALEKRDGNVGGVVDVDDDDDTTTKTTRAKNSNMTSG